MPFAELPPAPPALEVSAFDLEQVGQGPGGVDLKTVTRRCPKAAPGEIVVCAPDPEKERARDLPDTYVTDETLPRAEIDMGKGVSLDVHVDSGALPNGYTANRVMAGVKIKF